MTFSTLAQDSTPLSERILVAISGPLIAAIVGTGLITLGVWLLQRKLTERDTERIWKREEAEKRLQVEREEAEKRAQHEREAAEKRVTQERADNVLRRELVADMTSAAAKLYLSTQHYWRQQRAAKTDSSVDVASARMVVDKQYLESRLAGEVLESKLRAYCDDSTTVDEWHKVMDLLTVRYFQLTGEANDELYRENADGHDGRVHTGLTIAELRQPKTVLSTYRNSLCIATDAVLVSPLKESHQVSPPLRNCATEQPVSRSGD